MYLADSIIKNIGPPYVEIFRLNLVRTFCDTYFAVDDRTRASMTKLLGTWPPYFPQEVPAIHQALAARIPVASVSGGPLYVRRGGLVVEAPELTGGPGFARVRWAAMFLLSI